MEHELPIHLEHKCSSPNFGGVRVAQFLVFSWCFLDQWLSLLWYLQIFLKYPDAKLTYQYAYWTYPDAYNESR